MSDLSLPPASAETPAVEEYYVLMYTAVAVGPIVARSAGEAAHTAVATAPAVVNMADLTWVVQGVSTKPYEILDPSEEPPVLDTPAPPKLITG